MALQIQNKLQIDWINFKWCPDWEDYYPEVDVITDEMRIDAFWLNFPELDTELFASPICIDAKWSHYTKMIRCSMNCLLYFDGQDAKQQKGFCVQIPSSGLEWFTKLVGASSGADLIKWIHAHECQITRLDIAFDDFTKTFRPRQFVDFSLRDAETKVRKNMVTNMAKISMDESCRYGQSACTFYLGTRANKRFMRIYDKFLESDGSIDSVRYEFELHQDIADINAIYIENNVPISLRFFTEQFFYLVEDNNFGYGSHCLAPRLKIWEEFLDKAEFCEVIPFVKGDRSKNKKSKEWFYKQCLKTACQLFLDDEGEFIHDIMSKAKTLGFDRALWETNNYIRGQLGYLDTIGTS